MRLKVQNFVCLKDVDVELNDITFFIGEQASGKSLLCKLYFYFRQVLSDEMIDAIVEDKEFDDYKTSIARKFNQIFPKGIWNNNSFKIEFIVKEIEVSISYQRNTESFRIDFNEFFQKSYCEIKKEFHLNIKVNLQTLLSPHYIFKELIDNNKYSIIFESINYIPAGRSFFSAIAANVFGLLSEDIDLDLFLKNFGKQYERAKRDKLDTINQQVDDLINSILKGTVLIDKKDTFLISDDGVKTPLVYTSSGQQEALPLLLVLRHLLVRKPFWGTQSVVIEEPEAHLFPTAQKAIVDLLFLIKQQSQTKHFLITTHSPYILSCANNALLKNPDIKVNAYYLANGKANRIMDNEVGLIDGIDLDGVSYQIADEFDALLAQSQSDG